MKTDATAPGEPGKPALQKHRRMMKIAAVLSLFTAAVRLLDQCSPSRQDHQRAEPTVSSSAAEPAADQSGNVFRDCPDCPGMVVIPAGEFWMGRTPEQAAEEFAARGLFGRLVLGKPPSHHVVIGRRFALAEYDITRAEFSKFVNATGYRVGAGCTTSAGNRSGFSPRANWKAPGFDQSDRDPVVCVNWDDAQAYIAWLNRTAIGASDDPGRGPYRLPSEAELDYAARGGTTTVRWWGDAIGTNNANCQDCGSAWDYRRTSPVGSFRANPFGLFDVLGNVWQWTEDCWNQDLAAVPDDGSALVTGNCGTRVARGGGWTSTADWAIRSSSRSRFEGRKSYTGFRVAKTLP
jgi:formylglycine-generating enzyme required for sulfatase activity